MLLFLGFGGRIPKFPFVTIALAIALFFTSFKSFWMMSSYENEKTQKYESREYTMALLAVTQEQCLRDAANLEFCQALSNFSAQVLKNNEPILAAETFAALLDSEENAGFAKYIQSVKKIAEKNPDDLMALASFVKLNEINTKIQTHLNTIIQDRGLYSSQNQSLHALALAGFIHSGHLHLFINLLVLFGFLIFTEGRASKVGAVITFLGGNTLGLSFEAIYNNTSTPILGSSAGVMAVLGLFFVLFFKRTLHFKFFIPFASRSYHFATYLALPILYCVLDMSGLLSLGSGISHTAHALGFLFGILVGLAEVIFNRLASPFLYRNERTLYEELSRETNNPVKALQLCSRGLKLNPDNYLFLSAGCMASLNVLYTDGEVGRAFITKYSASLCSIALKENQASLATTYLNAIPLNLPIIGFLRHVRKEDLLALNNLCLKDNNWKVCLRLLNFYLIKYPSSSLRPECIQQIHQILKHLTDFMLQHQSASPGILSDLAAIGKAEQGLIVPEINKILANHNLAWLQAA